MIYCVEDDPGIRELEVYALKAAGFDAAGFEDGEAFLGALEKARPDLVLLDVMLPGTDGVALLKGLKAHAATRALPVIMATARGAEYEKVISLDLGADDYLVKPFGMLEMVARVRAVLRRGAPQPERVLRAGPVTMNLETHTVTAAGEKVSLTMKEFDLLRVMLSRPGVVFTRDQLLSDVWNADYAGETRTVDVHIQTLRQKLGEAGALVETVRGLGYRIGEDAV